MEKFMYIGTCVETLKCIENVNLLKLFLYFWLSTIGFLLFTFFALFVELLQLGVCEDLNQIKQILQMEMKAITTLSLHNLLGKQKIFQF